MTGLDAISAYNGWAMAVTGALIVISGLACLSFIISQLHRIVSLFESKPEEPKKPIPKDSSPKKTGSKRIDINLLDDPATAARIYKDLAIDLGDSFELTSLFQLFNNEGLPHPHLTIRSLRESGFLVPLGEARFSWKNA